MFKNESLKALYTALNWALFTLGVHELVLVLTKPVMSFVVTFLCGCFFALGLYFTNARKAFNKYTMVLGTTMTFLLFTVAYNYIVLLQSPSSLLVLAIVSAVAFLVAAFLTLHFLHKPANGAN